MTRSEPGSVGCWLADHGPTDRGRFNWQLPVHHLADGAGGRIVFRAKGHHRRRIGVVGIVRMARVIRVRVNCGMTACRMMVAHKDVQPRSANSQRRVGGKHRYEQKPAKPE